MRFIFYILIIFITTHLYANEDEDSQKREEIFTWIYNQGAWKDNKDGTPSSGYGSSVEAAMPYMEYLVEFLNTHQIRSVVDVGCGDWSFSRFIAWNSVDYTGIDIVKKVIERNIIEFATPKIKFIYGDFLHIKELDLEAELLLCKDVLQHLTSEEIALFLKKITKYSHCLITNDIISCNCSVELENKDIKRGFNRPLDLSKPPFNVKGENVLEFKIKDKDDVKQVFYIRH